MYNCASNQDPAAASSARAKEIAEIGIVYMLIWIFTLATRSWHARPKEARENECEGQRGRRLVPLYGTPRGSRTHTRAHTNPPRAASRPANWFYKQ